MSENKTRLEPSLVRKVLCKLGIHKLAPIYTKYWEGYMIDWEQYCLYCDYERETPNMGRT